MFGPLTTCVPDSDLRNPEHKAHVKTKNDDDDIATSSYAELTVAFQLITGVNPYRGADPEKSTLRQRTQVFNSASRRMENIPQDYMQETKFKTRTRSIDSDLESDRWWKGDPTSRHGATTLQFG